VTVLAVDRHGRPWCAGTSGRARPAAVVEDGTLRELAPVIVD
jgi:hypothetical protein